MENKRLKEWLSPVAIATYIGTIGSTVAYIKDYPVLSIIILATLAVILLLSNLLFYQRYSRYKRYTEIDHLLHRLTHRARDFVVELRLSADVFEAEEKAAAAIRGALSTAADIFSKITDSPCVASLMLENSGKLRTVQYCHQVDPERESKPSSELPVGDGIAGQAFTTGDVVVWDTATTSFKKIRNEYERYYLSGLSVPFKAGMKYAGLLNIDTLRPCAFRKQSHKQIAAAVADQLGLIIETHSLWGDAYGK